VVVVPGSSSGSRATSPSTHPVNQEGLEGCAGAVYEPSVSLKGTGCFPASAPKRLFTGSQTIHSVSFHQVIKAGGISHLSKALSIYLSSAKLSSIAFFVFLAIRCLHRELLKPFD